MSADAEPLWSASGWAGSEPPLNGSAAAAAEAEAGRPQGPAERGGTAAELAATVAVQCVYALLCLLGLPGNALVIFVVLRYAKMRTATNIYLLNLAVADELFMLGAPFAAASAALRRWPFGRALCRAVLAVDGLNAFASAFCLSALSLDRYIAVAHPLRAATYRRPRVAKRAAGAAWLLALLAASPIPAFAGTAAARDGGAAACGLLWPGPAWAAAFAAYSGLLGFVLPALAMALCYALIAAKLRGAARPPGWRQRRRSEGRLTRLALAAAAAFVLCWAPFYALRLLELLLPGRLDAAAAADASLILGYANSCANPILYAFLSENFRRSFHGVLRRCLRDAGPCCCRAGDGRDGDDDEEPLDYRAAPRGDRKGCSWPPLPCQHDPLRPQPCCAPGALRTKTTPF